MIIKLLPEPFMNKDKSTIHSGLIKARIILYNSVAETKKVNFNKFLES